MSRTVSLRPRGAAIVAALGAIAVALFAPSLAEAGPGARASIIGGEAAAIADFPSLAFVLATRSKHEGFACTGSVIAPRLVLTAAHCVENLEVGGITPASEYAVATGRANPRQGGSGEVLEVSETHVFPGFDPGNTHGDAALLVLATPTSAPPLALAGPADSALYAGGAQATLVGWGLTDPDARSAPETLQTTSSVVLDPAACKSRTRSFYRPYSIAMQMCTIDPPDHRSGGCFGDSGGPAIAHRPDGSPVEIGIVSTGGPRCSTRLPNVFTRADLVSGWASEWVAAIETGGPPPGLRARLPGLTRESAVGLVFGVLRTRFGSLFTVNDGLRGGCRRLGSTRMSCELLWRHGARVYFATVTVFYRLEQNTVGWGSAYVVRRASVRCLDGEHPGRCRVETRRG